jgi:2-methylisocitrate lyase-like PEP mutase family enzyme
MNSNINRKFRDMVEGRNATLIPGVANALAARIVEDLGFEAVYLSGAGLSNTFLGLPDLGFVGLPELVAHTAAIRDAVGLPIVVDADTGFGNALNVRYTVRALERAGASANQLEDQVSPKRCGHFEGKSVVSTAEMVQKVRAAVDARIDADLLIIARTDARAGWGLAAAIERAQAYAEAGADVMFVEAPESRQELESIPQRLALPQVANVVIGGKTPILDAVDLRRAGFAIVLYANAALQGAVYGMQMALRHLRDSGRLDETGPVASFRERQRLVKKEDFDLFERQYASREER